MKKCIFALSLLVLSPLTVAQTNPRAGLEGLTGLVQRTSDWETGPADLATRGRVQLNGWVNITEDGCLKVRGRLTSGDRFNSDWVNLGVGNDEADLSISLRNLYVSAACLENITIEAGAASVRSNGSLGLTSRGHVDGLNIIIADEENGREWLLTVGRIDPEANLLERDLDKPNLASIQLRQELGDNGSAFVAVSRFEDLTFSRAGINWVLSQYVEWLNQAGAEVIVSGTRPLGGMAHTSFEFNNWRSRVAISQISMDSGEGERVAFQMKDFYGYGRNMYFETSRDLSRSLSINGRLRIGDAGNQFQIGLSKKLPLNR